MAERIHLHFWKWVPAFVRHLSTHHALRHKGQHNPFATLPRLQFDHRPALLRPLRSVFRGHKARALGHQYIPPRLDIFELKLPIWRSFSRIPVVDRQRIFLNRLELNRETASGRVCDSPRKSRHGERLRPRQDRTNKESHNPMPPKDTLGWAYFNFLRGALSPTRCTTPPERYRGSQQPLGLLAFLRRERRQEKFLQCRQHFGVREPFRAQDCWAPPFSTEAPARSQKRQPGCRTPTKHPCHTAGHRTKSPASPQKSFT